MQNLTFLLLAAAVGLVSKIVWDWLSKRNGNGTAGNKPSSFWEQKFDDLAEANQKGFETSLQISVVPILKRQTEILDEMRADSKELQKAIIRLGLRDEVREELRRNRPSA